MRESVELEIGRNDGGPCENAIGQPLGQQACEFKAVGTLQIPCLCLCLADTVLAHFSSMQQGFRGESNVRVLPSRANLFRSNRVLEGSDFVDVGFDEVAIFQIFLRRESRNTLRRAS